jgi:hypothetical protein
MYRDRTLEVQSTHVHTQTQAQTQTQTHTRESCIYKNSKSTGVRVAGPSSCGV